MIVNCSWLGILLIGLLAAVSAGSEQVGYPLPWIAEPLDDLPYVVQGDGPSARESGKRWWVKDE